MSSRAARPPGGRSAPAGAPAPGSRAGAGGTRGGTARFGGRGGRRAPAARPAAPSCRWAGTRRPGDRGRRRPRPRARPPRRRRRTGRPRCPGGIVASRSAARWGPWPLSARSQASRRASRSSMRPVSPSPCAGEPGGHGRLGPCAHWSSTPSAVPSTVREVPAPEPPPRRRGRAGGGQRHLPQRLARLAGPRPGRRRCRTCPGTSWPARSPRSAPASRGWRSATG